MSVKIKLEKDYWLSDEEPFRFSSEFLFGSGLSDVKLLPLMLFGGLYEK